MAAAEEGDGSTRSTTPSSSSSSCTDDDCDVDGDLRCAVLVIGSGIAGAACALRLLGGGADSSAAAAAVTSPGDGCGVVVVTRSADPKENSTLWAQGGIITRGLPPDSADLLVADVLRAGAGISLPEAARVLAEEGPALVRDVLQRTCAVRFDAVSHDQLPELQDVDSYPQPSPPPASGADPSLLYALEAAHSTRRIVHVGDKTGEAIMVAMLAALRRRGVRILTEQTVVDLITFPHHARDPLALYREQRCQGAYVLSKGRIRRILAARTVLASGGLGQLFRNTTNPAGARGDGIAMAWRAGARIVNTEYVQFHPTTLYVRGAPNLLVSEAVRGEGAVLLTPAGVPFMHRYSPEWGDLAPRDVVARAIHREMIENRYECVFLDLASKRPPDFIRARFPKLMATCRTYGIDPTHQPIPVVPAAHYSCGGVLCDLWGRTSISGLYAVGEVSCTGVHGANRLASTSLLEGLVWGDRTGRDILAAPSLEPVALDAVPEWETPPDGTEDPDPALIASDLNSIQTIMWHYVGLERNQRRLQRADDELRHLNAAIEDFYRHSKLTDPLIGLHNAIQAARVITWAAKRTKISRGTHFRSDGRSTAHPEMLHLSSASVSINGQ